MEIHELQNRTIGYSSNIHQPIEKFLNSKQSRKISAQRLKEALFNRKGNTVYRYFHPASRRVCKCGACERWPELRARVLESLEAAHVSRSSRFSLSSSLSPETTENLYSKGRKISLSTVHVFGNVSRRRRLKPSLILLPPQRR